MNQTEDERQMLEQSFCRIYRPLQKQHGLRCHECFDVFGNNMIEIWEHEGEKRGRRICKVEEETAEECLRRAIDSLEWYAMLKDISNKEGKKNCDPPAKQMSLTDYV